MEQKTILKLIPCNINRVLTVQEVMEKLLKANPKDQTKLPQFSTGCPKVEEFFTDSRQKWLFE